MTSASPTGLARRDAAMLSWIQSGDPDALQAFFREFHQQIYRWCRIALRDPQDAEEATSRVFLAVTRTRLRGVAQLVPYVRKTALNACNTVARERSRSAADELADDLPAQRRDEDEDLTRAELRQVVWRAMAGLEPRDRFLFEAEWRDRLDNHQLAELAGTAQPYVVLNRMRKQVKAALGAALVAWYGRKDCPQLNAIITETGTELSPLLRKRINRHINGTPAAPGCPTCQACRDRWPLPVLGSALPGVVVLEELRARLVSFAHATALDTSDASGAAHAGGLRGDVSSSEHGHSALDGGHVWSRSVLVRGAVLRQACVRSQVNSADHDVDSGQLDEPRLAGAQRNGLAHSTEPGEVHTRVHGGW